MGYLCLGLTMVLWIGVAVSLLVRNQQRKAEQRLDPNFPGFHSDWFAYPGLKSPN